jgi:hypothetical protein
MGMIRLALLPNLLKIHSMGDRVSPHLLPSKIHLHLLFHFFISTLLLSNVIDYWDVDPKVEVPGSDWTGHRPETDRFIADEFVFKTGCPVQMIYGTTAKR